MVSHNGIFTRATDSIDGFQGGKKAEHTFTIVISTPARCKIGAAFFSNRLLAFLEIIETGSMKHSEKKTGVLKLEA